MLNSIHPQLLAQFLLQFKVYKTTCTQLLFIIHGTVCDTYTSHTIRLYIVQMLELGDTSHICNLRRAVVVPLSF